MAMTDGSGEATLPLWEGDAQVFERLYERHYHVVVQLARRVGADSGLAEDVGQIVFLKLWLARGQFTRINLEGWLHRVTRNQTIDILRQVKSRTFKSSSCEPTGGDGVFDEVYQKWYGSCVAATLEWALDRLPPNQRAAVVSNFIHGQTHNEIASRTGTPIGTIKTRIRSGRLRLRTLLATHEWTGEIGSPI